MGNKCNLCHNNPDRDTRVQGHRTELTGRCPAPCT
ncbi:hypothetical protein phiSTEC1575Stx2k_42 [Escherichia phage phiSTEC1575-Stx2k]|nr:hypothetical protein phiSTEC1575Stx2k_42 [Escherichia phage phiSTEC1575-Stx2k]